MLKFIKKMFLILLLFISAIGLIISVVSYFDIIIIGVNSLLSLIFIPLITIPIVYIPVIVISGSKSGKYKGEKERYFIRFYSSIRNVPKQFAIMIYAFVINLVIVIILYSNGYCKDWLILASGLILFYYIPTLIYLSAIMDKE